MLRLDERLARAGERFLMSKTVEVYMGIITMVMAAAVLIIVTFWVFHQLRTFGAVWGW